MKDNRYLAFILGLIFLIVAVSAFGLTNQPRVAAIARAREIQTRAPSDCETLHTFGSGETLLLCPAEPTGAPVVETVTPALVDTVTATIPPTGTDTPLLPTPTDTPQPTDTDTPLPPTPTRTDTPLPPTATLLPPTFTPTPGNVAPFPAAPACPDVGVGHNYTVFHTLWDAARGCHYDHEHGASPFTPAIAAAFPGFDLRALLCDFEIGHCNPSSPIENLTKHGGMKWQVSASAPQGCAVGFEGGTVAIDAYAIQYHAFGPQSVEFEARQHSAVALLRQCKPGAPSDKGYIYVAQLQEYGQRTLPYQGQVLAYPNNFQPAYASNFGPYFTTEGFGNCTGCRASLAYYDGQLSHNNLTVWTSKRTGPVSQQRPETSSLLAILFRGRDAYQVLDASDLVHPFTWAWACGGAAYNPVGCRYNNSSITLHEVKGTIPAAWDGLAGWDTDTRAGRVTATGFVTRYGQLAPTCTAPSGLDCQVIKLVGAFVGTYSSEISVNKVSNPTAVDTPERDIYFLNGQVVSETTPGAVPSGWIGPNN